MDESKKSSNTSISKALGVDIFQERTKTLLGSIAKVDPTTHDYDYLRDRLHELIDSGQTLLQDAMDIVGQTQSAAGYQATAVLLRSVVDAVDVLAKVNAKKTDIKAGLDEANNNTGFVLMGSSKEIKAALKKIKEDKEDATE